jgi:hypothetical protein
MQKPKPRKLDALVLLARASGGRRKRQTVIGLLVLAGLLLAVGALFVWWVWPGPEPPAVLLAVFDQAARPDETVTLAARLDTVDPARAGEVLSGYALMLEAPSVEWQQQGRSDADGFFRADAAFPQGAAAADVIGRFPGNPRRKQRGTEGRGRVFVWPADTALVLVDADGALADGEAAAFWETNNLDLRPRPGATAALQAARAHVVYVSAGADRPARHVKLRAWLEQSGQAGPHGLPDGPVFSRAGQPAADPVEFHRTVAQQLKGRFSGPAVAVTASAEHARAYHEAGVRTVLFDGVKEVPSGVVSAKSWAEVVNHFGK